MKTILCLLAFCVWTSSAYFSTPATCTQDSDCTATDANAVCTFPTNTCPEDPPTGLGRCTCKTPGYSEGTNLCYLMKNVGDTCTSSSANECGFSFKHMGGDVDEVRSAYCSLNSLGFTSISYSCQCWSSSDREVGTSLKLCIDSTDSAKKFLGETCTSTDTCILNGVCSGGICTCPSTSHEVDIMAYISPGSVMDGTQTTGIKICRDTKGLYDACTLDADCDGFEAASGTRVSPKCIKPDSTLTNGYCGCPYGATEYGDTPFSMNGYTSSWWATLETPSSYTQNYCYDYSVISYTNQAVGATCSYSGTINCAEGMICSYGCQTTANNYKCMCAGGYAAGTAGDTTCTINKAGATCTLSSDCPFGVCTAGTCADVTIGPGSAGNMVEVGFGLVLLILGYFLL
jgi:hypothetical protein